MAAESFGELGTVKIGLLVFGSLALCRAYFMRQESRVIER